MKGSTGTSTSGSMTYRPRQKGNRRCKDCEHLQYLVSIRGDEQFNYYCDATHQPKHYTSKCFCKRFKAKQWVRSIANFFRVKAYYPLACEKRSKSGIPTSVSVEISIGIHNYPPFSAFSCLVRIITEQRWVQRWYRKQQGFADAEGVQKVAQKWYQKKASASFQQALPFGSSQGKSL